MSGPEILQKVLEAFLVGVVAPGALLLGQWLLRRYRRPILEIDSPPGKGFRVEGKTRIDHEEVETVWLRVRVSNIGYSTAKGVQVFLSRYGATGTLGGSQERKEFDPAPLIWAHTDTLDLIERINVDLPPKTHRYADFVAGFDEHTPLLLLRSPTSDENFFDAAADHGGLDVEFLAVDSNGNSSARTLKFSWDGTRNGLKWE